LNVYDEVGIHYYLSADGRTLAAVKLRADLTTIRGVIQQASPNDIEVEVGSGVSENVTQVHLSLHTVYGFSKTLMGRTRRECGRVGLWATESMPRR